MIEKLTKEQEIKIPEYLNEWMKHGLSTDRLDFDLVKTQIHWLYSTFLKEHSGTPLVFVASSPFQAVVWCTILKNLSKNKNSEPGSELDSQLGSELRSQLDSQLHFELSSQLVSQLRSQLVSQLGFELRSQLGSELFSQLDSQLRSQLYSQLSFQLGPELSSQLSFQLGSQLGSQLRSELTNLVSLKYSWSGYYAFYNFIQKELLPEVEMKHLDEISELTKTIPMMFPNKGFCVVVDNPTEIHRKGIVLHNEKDMAVKYSDGWGTYSLNGIRMDKKWIETEAKDISVIDVLKEQNVDVRREVLRKIGLERFVKETSAKCLDKLSIALNGKMCEYQLLEINLGSSVTARVLKMDNPSIDAMHVEGVEDTCNTVKEALAWRNGFASYVEPKQLT
jgi:hypothetical protein